MAGYFRKAEAFNYLGSEKAGEALANGVFVSITSNGVKKLTAAGDSEFRVAEKTTLWGLPALVLICVVPGSGETYVVENEFEDYGDKDFNYAAYEVPTGHYVKMRRPNINDELIISVDSTTYAALSVGDTVKPASGGGVAKKST
jgi:hypothetical protein